MFNGEHIVSTGNAGVKLDPHFRICFGWLFQNFHLIQEFFAALCPPDGFFPVERAELGDHFFLMADFLLLIEPGAVARFPEHSFFLTVGGVVSLETLNDSLIDLNYFCHHPVKKIAVVGDDQNSSGII